MECYNVAKLGENDDDPMYVQIPKVLCRSYDYSLDAQKLKFFPTTLKDGALKWFMGLGTNSIRS